MTDVDIALGLGGNIGDAADTLDRALLILETAGIVTGLRRSALYATPPYGPVPQADFVNACAIGRTRLAPDVLLRRCKAVEVALGRVETVRWGPRVIDIDILFYGDVEMATPALTLPHADLLNRAFVLIPLAELCPDKRIEGRRIAEAAAGIDSTGVRRLAP